jgi:hypothetical protein
VVEEFFDREGGSYAVAYRVPPGSVAAVEPQHPLTVNLDGKVRLLGYDLKAEPYKPGEVIGLTLYWQALTAVEKDYTVFTHLLGSYNPLTNGPLWGGQDSRPGGGTYPRRGRSLLTNIGYPFRPTRRRENISWRSVCITWRPWSGCWSWTIAGRSETIGFC